MFRIKRSLAALLAMCLVVAMLPANVIALGNSIGDTVITGNETPPAAVDGAVWVLIDSVECKKIEHTHTNTCYYKSCDHADGHMSSCYSSATEYALCTHNDESQHAGAVKLSDVVEISGTNLSWKTEHPAYPVVKAAYDTEYNRAYAASTARLDFMKKAAALAAAIKYVQGNQFCYTTNASAAPDLCTHTCSELGGSCYTKLCLLSEHTHTAKCYQYTWELKSDVNKNSVADDVDTYYVVKYVNDGTVVYEKPVLVNMPTPTVDNPSKPADAQYTYTFVGWDTPVADTVTGDVTYTAVYSNTVNKYNVTWQDEDGTALETDTGIDYGTMPTYDGKEPSKPGNNTVTYTFAGWTPTVSPVTGDVTYTATYTTKSVYAFNFHVDGKFEFTDYVVEDEKLNAYTPSRAHYTLSTWKTAEGEEFDFTAAVTGGTDLYATWILTESVVNVTAPNAVYTPETDIYTVGSEVVITITPNAGYAVTSVMVNGESAALTHKDGVATVKFTAENETYNVVATVKLAKLVLDAAEMNIFGDLNAGSIFDAVYNKTESVPNWLTADKVTVEYKAFSITLFGRTYDWWVAPGTNVSLEAFLNQYNLGALASYIPEESQPHEFGAQSIENVRVSYAGNDMYPELSAETTVALIDLRTPSEVKLNSGVSVVYGATLDEIKALVFKEVTSEHGTVEDTEVDVKIDSLNAGTRKVTVSFAGNREYAPSVAEVDVTINKAQGMVEVEAFNTKYGTAVSIADLVHSDAKTVQILLGLTAGENASVDAGTLVHVNLPALVDVDSIENELVKKLVEHAMEKLNDVIGKEMTISELKTALEEILPYIELIENAGVETTLSKATIDMLVAALNQLSELDGVGEFKLRLTMGADMQATDAGVYLVAAVTADGNYTTAFNMNYGFIAPDGYRAELDWKIHDENGIITLEALRGNYDLGAKVTSVLEGSVEDAEKHMYVYFMGVNKAGEMVITSNQKDLDIGAYAEVAFIADFGNTMYYAEPIARTFLVAADVVDVKFLDENGKENNDRVFAYGEDATMNATAFDRETGEVEKGAMTYLYVGVQTDGEVYYGTTAPTKPGVYTVMALFIGEDTENVGAAMGALVIEQRDTDFELTDVTVEYDGNSHFVEVKDTVGLDKVYVIVDESGNVNVILPEDWNVEGSAVIMNAQELLEKLEDMAFPGTPEEFEKFMEELETVMSEIEVKKIDLNEELPVKVGTYTVYGVAFGNPDYKLAFDEATLTITEPEIPEPPKCEHGNDPDSCTECNKQEPEKCPHGNNPETCEECNATPEDPKCEHGNHPETCPECNQTPEEPEKCPHGNDKDTCEECNKQEPEKCEHGNDAATCPECNPVVPDTCEHGNNPDTCEQCHPVNTKCVHGNDPDTCPTCNAEVDSPQTGDNSHLGLWFMLMMASGAALVWLFVSRKRFAYSGKYVR